MLDVLESDIGQGTLGGVDPDTLDLRRSNQWYRFADFFPPLLPHIPSPFLPGQGATRATNCDRLLTRRLSIHRRTSELSFLWANDKARPGSAGLTQTRQN